MIAANKMLLRKENALAPIQEGKPGESLTSLLAMMKKRYGNSPILLNFIAEAYLKIGDMAGAKKIYSLAMAQENTPDNPFIAQGPDGFTRHIDLLLAMNNVARANEVIEEGARRFGDDTIFLPQRSRIAFKSRDYDGMGESMARCADVGGQDLTMQCRNAIGSSEVEAAWATMAAVERDKFQKAQAGGFFKSLTGGD